MCSVAQSWDIGTDGRRTSHRHRPVADDTLPDLPRRSTLCARCATRGLISTQTLTMMNTSNFVRVFSMAILLSVLQLHSAALAQSLTVPAQFVYWTTYGPPGGPGSRYYYFATGDEACQFACEQGDSRCRDSTQSSTWTGSPGVCFGPFTQTIRFWRTQSPYWAYESPRGQHCKVPVRQTDSLTPVTQPPYICGFSTGDPRSDISWIQQYDWVGSGWICPLGAGYQFNNTDKTCTLYNATAYPPPQRSPKCGNPVMAGSGCKIGNNCLSKTAKRLAQHSHRTTLCQSAPSWWRAFGGSPKLVSRSARPATDRPYSSDQRRRESSRTASPWRLRGVHSDSSGNVGRY